MSIGFNLHFLYPLSTLLAGLFQELQGEAVLLNLKSGVYFGLDPVGTRIWELFAKHDRLPEIARTVIGPTPP